MKKVLFLLLTVITVCSCYNDDDLWDKVNDLDGRVETLETTVKGMNSDITALQNLVDALNQGKVIINTEQTSEGYTLTFNDGSKVSIKNGTNGTDAPVIGIKADEDGTYYWTITTNGVTDWLPDADNKLKVTGTTPIMGVDDDGYWTVDTGDGAQPINGADGKPIKAKGEDGDSFFKSVTVNDNYVLVTLEDGTSFTLPKGETYTFDIANRDYTLFSSNETRTYLLTTANIDDATLIAIPQGWTAVLNDKDLKITAPAVSGDDVKDGELKILVTPSKAFGKVIKMQLRAVHEARFLTFEDADYKGDANIVGETNWSSLIDNPQYNGPLLYPTTSTLYQWNDKNNTFLASELPNGWGDYKYWGGGHAISNYVETDMANGDYLHQLGVYYQDPITGFGGHNGSKNFCVHYGYKDDSGFTDGAKLPSIYFSDNQARVVDHMYVMWNTYLANCIFNGNSLTEPVGPDGYVKIIAIGFDAAGKEITNHLEFFIANAGGNIQEWTYWDLSSLGKVSKIEFNMAGDSDNGYGFSQPAYFCYDDVAVRF